MKNEKSAILTEAEEIFGADVVETVVALVETSDPDGAWSLFKDQGMDEHAECVEFIYFEN
jgi:hypothetical protein